MPNTTAATKDGLDGSHKFLSVSRPPIYSMTFIISTIATTLVLWSLICYFRPYAKGCVHSTKCGCKMDHAGELLVEGKGYNKAMNKLVGGYDAPATRHCEYLKRKLGLGP